MTPKQFLSELAYQLILKEELSDVEIAWIGTVYKATGIKRDNYYRIHLVNNENIDIKI